MKLSRVGVDLAKNVYQLHGVDRFGSACVPKSNRSYITYFGRRVPGAGNNCKQSQSGLCSEVT